MFARCLEQQNLHPDCVPRFTFSKKFLSSSLRSQFVHRPWYITQGKNRAQIFAFLVTKGRTGYISFPTKRSPENLWFVPHLSLKRYHWVFLITVLSTFLCESRKTTFCFIQAVTHTHTHTNQAKPQLSQNSFLNSSYFNDCLLAKNTLGKGKTKSVQVCFCSPSTWLFCCRKRRWRYKEVQYLIFLRTSDITT